MQGVRQLGPSEVLASAPGGSDSIVSETLAPPEKLGTQSQLGVQEAQPATSRAQPMPHTRTTGIIVNLRPRPPRLPTCAGPYGEAAHGATAVHSRNPIRLWQDFRPSRCDLLVCRSCGSRRGFTKNSNRRIALQATRSACG